MIEEKKIEEVNTADINLNLRSEEVQDILSYVPNWIVRWGITVLFFILFLVFIASYFIKYPDVISSRIIITTQDPPARIVANTSGKITHFSVIENQKVKENDLLAVIESGAKIENIFDLQKDLDEFGSIIIRNEKWGSFNFKNRLVLGELQSDYSQLLQSYTSYTFFEENNYYNEKIQLLENQIIKYNNLNSKLKLKKELDDKQLTIAQTKYNTDKQLFEQQVTSKIDFSNSEENYLQIQSRSVDVEIPIINNDIQLSEYQKTIADLKHQFQQQENDLTMAVEENYKKMQSQLALWKKKYLFISPINGKTAFFKYWNNNQFISAGEEFMTVVPDSNEIIGKIYVSGLGVGKIKVGQRVKIKLDNYPFDKYGAINGEVKSISSISRENQYLINIYLPNKLNTTYKKSLGFKQEMQGTAEIITEDLRLIERLFNQLKSIKDNSL